MRRDYQLVLEQIIWMSRSFLAPQDHGRVLATMSAIWELGTTPELTQRTAWWLVEHRQLLA